VLRDRRTVEASLLAKGFELEDRHHRYFIYHASDGTRTSVKTKTSHGSSSKTLGDPLLVQMAKQCGVTKPQFLDLVDCPLDRDAYEQLLRERNLI